MPQFLLSNRFWTAFGAMLAALAVAAGAYGWHALEGDQAFRDIFMLAVQYHMWHALGLIAVGWRCAAGPGAAKWAAFAGICFSLGIVLFSGNLYVFAMQAQVALKGAAPVGGAAFMAGWALLAVSALAKSD